MSQAVQALTSVDDPEVELEPFLQELTELSRKHKIGITGNPVLFCLDEEDLNRTYTSDADSALVY